MFYFFPDMDSLEVYMDTDFIWSNREWAEKRGILKWRQKKFCREASLSFPWEIFLLRNNFFLPLAMKTRYHLHLLKGETRGHTEVRNRPIWGHWAWAQRVTFWNEVMVKVGPAALWVL